MYENEQRTLFLLVTFWNHWNLFECTKMEISTGQKSWNGKFSNLAHLWLHSLLRPCFKHMMQKMLTSMQNEESRTYSKSGVFNYLFWRAIEDQRRFSGRCGRAKWTPLLFMILCILKLIKRPNRNGLQARIGPLATIEKACSKSPNRGLAAS